MDDGHGSSIFGKDGEWWTVSLIPRVYVSTSTTSFDSLTIPQYLDNDPRMLDARQG